MTNERNTVLVVDDDVDLLQMMEIVLQQAGYRVMTAGNGQEALAKLALVMPAVILLDMKMPGMDGWEFASVLRTKYDKFAPIIVVTAAEDARKRAEEIGAVDALGKPFELDDLIRIVEHHANG